jgi:hypothetical protein
LQRLHHSYSRKHRVRTALTVLSADWSSAATAAGCNVITVYAPAQSKADWKVTYDPSCTAAQIAPGNAAMDAWTAAHQ